ncbi:DHS-like NAD/FAD-binding domain-containing protein [Amylocystis lapponica]|nr:DHS-like NAD/FAD-binding domain-containing protein [Amylocystis lapponica]
MTVFLPLEADTPFPQAPSFLTSSSDPAAHVKKVVKAIMKARRIAVVCGAGISVQAGIPDFRSSDGLFQSLKKDNPTLCSGKDLFDASVFNSEVTTSLFCQMIAQLSELSEAALPTSFHALLRALDDRRKLLRVYTQNIDALELKSGLTFGVPEVDGKRHKPRSKAKADGSDEAVHAAAEATSSRLPSPPVETPRCIPLHGTLQLMHCQTCTHSFPLRNHLDALTSGRPPYCPECTALEETRQLVGKRSRGVGKLRPSVVLYNEVHKDGEEVGEVVRRDLVGSSKGKGRAGADLLLVVGTSLRVPGTKRIVREFSKAVRSRASVASAPPVESAQALGLGLGTPTPSPRRSPADDEEPPVKTVYLNLDFPVPTREWEGVFDVWIRGDAQDFARMVLEEMEKEERAKEAAVERKRQREEAALAAQAAESEQAGAAKPSRKRKGAPISEARPQPTKKRKYAPVTPVSTAKSKRASKAKKPVSSVLPTLPRGHSKTKLTIKIPPRPAAIPPTPPPSKRAHLVPEVVIPAKRSTLVTPPPSPLTPISSPSPSPRRKSSTSKVTSKRKPAARKKPPPTRGQHAGAKDTAHSAIRRDSIGTDSRASSPLSDPDSN